MAVVDGPAMSLRASGNVGSICYSTWRGMQIARDRWTGVQPCVGQQAVVQGYYREIVRAWGGVLNSDQRRLWGEFAAGQTWVNKLGLTWVPTGYLAFVRLGLEALNLGASYEVNPPVQVYKAMARDVSVEQPGWEAMVRVAMSNWMNGIEPDVMQVWRAGPFTSGGYHATSGEYRVVEVVGSPFSWDDWGVVDQRYYWYRVRWGFNVGIVGVMYEQQVWVYEYPPP